MAWTCQLTAIRKVSAVGVIELTNDMARTALLNLSGIYQINPKYFVKAALCSTFVGVFFYTSHVGLVKVFSSFDHNNNNNNRCVLFYCLPWERHCVCAKQKKTFGRSPHRPM